MQNISEVQNLSELADKLIQDAMEAGNDAFRFNMAFENIRQSKESEDTKMEYQVKVTVLDKKLFPELQARYCAVPDSGKCPCYNVGDEFLFYRNDERDDCWHMGAGTLVKSGKPDEGVLMSPGTMHCGTEGVPFCAEAWDAISRYIYAALQGGAIMRGWTKDDKVMIACCNDGTRPVIFKIERIDVSES